MAFRNLYGSRWSGELWISTHATPPGLLGRCQQIRFSDGMNPTEQRQSMSDPTPLSAVLAELIARRGFARTQGVAQLAVAWREVAGEKIASMTKVICLQRGVFEVGVANSALLSELTTFHRATLLPKLQAKYPEQKIRDLKFKLRSDLQKKE
jgi:predicted nucleic acid-binding Zn ribbon protein